MFWTPKDQYLNDPFETEAQIESTIAEVTTTFFGPNRIYLDVKTLIAGNAPAQKADLTPEEFKIMEGATA